MNPPRSTPVWLATLTLAAAGALISACGPQDGGSAKPTQPVALAAPTTEPATAPVAAPPTAPMDAPPPVAAKPPPVHVAKPAAPKPPAPKPVVAKTEAPQAVKVPAAPAPNTVGAVQSIEPITETHASGVGAVAGGALGGVLGHQFGKGDGKKAMTVLGAVGGAVAGHQIGKSHNAKVVGYRVQVQLDSGETRTFEPKELEGLKVGDRVRVDQGLLRRV